MSETVQQVDLKRIRPNRLNPRLDLNIQELNMLAESIEKKGLLQPLVVRPVGDHYEVVIGERRYRAAQQVGLERVPVIIHDYSDREVVELNLIENVQRTDLSAVEKGNCCKQLIEKYPEKFPNKRAVAEAIGVSKATVNAWLELVEAPKELQTMIAPATKIGVPRETGKIDYDTAVTITRRIKEPERQIEIAREIAKRPIYRREARRVISLAAKEPEKPVERVFEEVVEAPYELPFRLAHMKLILEGVKIQTSRKGIPDPKIKIGSIVHAAVWQPHFADLRIVSIERKRLGDFTDEDAEREGGYTLDQFKDVWKRLHGEWNEEETVYVIGFERAE